MPRFAKFAFLVLLIQLLTSAAVLLNVPVARQALSLICFVALIGMVTLPLLKIKPSSGSELLVYSCGLGLVLLMVIGLAVNTLYPIISAPLSTIPMLIALNLYMLAAIACGLLMRRESPLPSGDPQEKKPHMLPRLYAAAIALLPAMAIIGTWAMNLFGFNLILLLMIVAIAVIFIAILVNQDVPDGVNSLFIISSGVSLLLLYSMRSSYLMGFDIHGEYYAFTLTLNNYHWSLADYLHIYNTCLSITILPTVLASLMNMAPEYMFKLVFQLAFALMPLAVYLFFKDKVDRRLALLAAFFMMAHYMFYYQMPGLVRQEVSLFLFVLAVYVLFTDRIKQPGGMALFLLFSLGTVVSHYSTSFVFLFMLAATFLITKYIVAIKKPEVTRITALLVLAVAAMVLFWHGLVSRITLSAAIWFVVNTLQSVNNMLMDVSSTQSPIASMVLGKGIQSALPSLLSWGIGTLSRALVVIGVLYIAYITLFPRHSEDQQWMKFDIEYVVASVILVTLVIIGILVPFISVGYNLERLYMQSLIFLAPMCIVGMLALVRALFKNVTVDTAVTCAGLMVAVFFLCQTGVVYQAFGMPNSVSLNSDDQSGYLIYPEEVVGAQWLAANESPKSVYADNYGTLRLWSYGGIPRGYGYDTGAYVLSNDSYSYRKIRYDMLNSYVYLDYYNVNDGFLSSGWGTGQTPVSNFKYMDRMDEVYDNGGSAILKKSGRSL
jgi:uncharacterized membrane protein